MAAPSSLKLRGNDERVFCHPERGSVYRAEKFVDALALALKTAGVEGRVRAFHDLRHTAITNDAAAGANPTALMTKAGHSDMKTTKLYLHLAGVVLHDEAERLEASCSVRAKFLPNFLLI